MTARAHYEAAARSPGSEKESGLSHFMDLERMASKTPRDFTASLLNSNELDRVRALLWGPQRPTRLDKRLLNLGLAKFVLGKVVATKAAREAIWKQRYEIRRGNDKRPLQVVQTIETGSHKAAMTTAWNIAREDVGPRWQHHLLQVGEEPRWSIFLPPPRIWNLFHLRPYVLEIRKLTP